MNKGGIEINRGARPSVGQSGVGYVVVPDDETREEYIADCYKTSTVTIQGGFGYGFINNVPILGHVLQQIKFPNKSDERGTAVFWVRENFYNRPIIIGVMPADNYTNPLTNGQDRIIQQVGDVLVEIYQDASNGVMNMNVVGNSDNPAKINIKASTGTEDSEINIYTDGKVAVSANQLLAVARKDFNLQLKNGKDEELISVIGDEEKVEYKDQFKTNVIFNKDNVSLSSEIDVNVEAKDSTITSHAKEINFKTDAKLNLDGGGEPMVLGNQLTSFLQSLIQGIMSITVPTAVGPSGVPINAAAFSQLLGKLETLKSKKSNLD